MKKNSGFLKQYNVGIWLGGIKSTLQYTMFYITLINLILVATTAYSVNIRAWAEHYVSWFSLPIFAGILFVFIILAMLLEYKVVQPSTWAFTNWQTYEHNNPIKKDLKDIMDVLIKLDKRIESMKNKIDNRADTIKN